MMHGALVTRLDGLQANHFVLGGQLQGAVYLAPVVGVVSVGEQKVPDLVRGPRGRGALTCKCSSGLRRGVTTDDTSCVFY